MYPLAGEGVAAGCVPGPLPAAAVSWLRKLLPGSSDCPGELFATAPDGLNPRTASTAAAAASTSGGGPVTPRTPAGSSITPAAATPRNSIARLISGRGARGGSISPAAGAAAALASPAGGLLGPDGVPVGSLFALADHLSQAATAALTTARSAFNTAAEEEAKVRLVIHMCVGAVLACSTAVMAVAVSVARSWFCTDVSSATATAMTQRRRNLSHAVQATHVGILTYCC